MYSALPVKVYLKLKKRILIRSNQMIKLRHLVNLMTDDEQLEKSLHNLVIHEHQVKEGNRVVIDVLQIVKKVNEHYPNLQIEVFGGSQILVVVSDKVNKPKYIVLILCWLLLFFGAGMAIMNFHADVNMRETQIRLVELITGQHVDRPLWFQIPYSIGVGGGMVLFFNHIFRKKFNEEPSPLEVEMFMYQENLDNFVVDEETRKKNNSQRLSSGEVDDH